MPFANRHNYKFKHKPSLFDCSFIARKTNKVFAFRAPVRDHYNVNGKYRRRCIRSHPSHCLQADAGRRRAASVQLHARCARLDLINKYMRFYGHFVPTMQTHFLHLFRSSCTRWASQNPALFVGKNQEVTAASSGFCRLRRRAVLHGGETQVFSSVIVGTNLL